MKLWQVGLSMVCCGSLLLSGCSDRHKISTLQESQDNIYNEIKTIRKQIKNMEEVILTLNGQIEEIQSMRAAELADRRDALQKAKPAAGPELTTEEKKAANIFTRPEFSARVGGIAPASLVKFIGEPDKQEVKEGSEYWNYSAVSFKVSETNRESVGIQIVFENKRVDRVVFMDDVQYGP